MATNLTIQQEKFAQKFAECGVASEAYRFAYKCQRSSEKTIWENSCRLVNDVKVAARIAELRAETAKASRLTREQKLITLEELMAVRVSDYFDDSGVFIPFSQHTEAMKKCLASFNLAPTQFGNKITITIHNSVELLKIHNQMTGDNAPTQIDLAVRAPKAMTTAEIEEEINKLNND